MLDTFLDFTSALPEPGLFGEESTPVGTVKLIKGKVGPAARMHFVAESRGGYFRLPLRADSSWNKAAGFSFWVKGDGSDGPGGLALVDRKQIHARYLFEFPLDSTKWRQFLVPWCDLLPGSPYARLIDPRRGYKPSGFGAIWFGKAPYLPTWPAHTFAVDGFRLEAEIPVDTTNYRPAAPGLPRVLAKLRAKQPVTIVTMGDSLTSPYHWANREVIWTSLLADRLTARTGSELTVANVSMGGHQLTHGLLRMPTWVPSTPDPDLVTVWFGGNDWSDGMRRAQFEDTLRFAIARIRRLTQGSADLLLMTTVTALETWGGEIQELAEATRAVAAEEGTGLVDTYAAFAKAGRRRADRERLYAWDKVHLGEYGHEVTAEAVLKALA